MKKDFTLHEQALALKELGFDNETCFGLYFGTSIKEEAEFLLEFRSSQYSVAKGYVDGILAPTFSQAFRWFREKYNIHGIISYYGKGQWFLEVLDYKGNQLIQIENNTFWSYEEAELECLIKLIEIVKENLHN
jgi:hypothetical protein